MNLSPLPKMALLDNNGQPAVGYQLFVYGAGTTIKATTYKDQAGASLNTNPILLNYRGEADVWLDAALAYKFVLASPTDTDPPANPIWTVDNIAGALSILDLTQQFLGKILWPRTTVEISTAVTPTNYGYPVGNPWRYGADGLGGAADIAALAAARLVVSTATGVETWRNGVPFGSFLRTPAEVSAAVLPTDYSRLTEPYDIRREGAKLNNVTDDFAAVTRSLLVGTQTVSGALGSAISVAAGTSLLSSMVQLRNRVRTIGVNKRGSYFQAKAGWSVGAAWSAATNYVTNDIVIQGGVLYIARQASLNQVPPNATFWNPIANAMFYAANGYTAGVGGSMFDCAIENCSIDVNSIANLGCVLSSAWQEGGGLKECLLLNFTTFGVKFQDGFGGASLCEIKGCEIFGSAAGATVGVYADVSASAAFMLKIENTSIVGGGATTASLPRAIHMIGASLTAINVHFEVCQTGIYLDGAGNHVLINCTGAGSTSGIDTLIEIAATFTGTLTAIGCFRNGATNFLKDNRANGFGTLGYDLPFFQINASASLPMAAVGLPWSGGQFDGSIASPVFAAGTSFNCTGITKNGAGDYTITETRARPNVSCTPWVMCNLANASYRTDLVGAASYRLRIYVGGVLTDSNEVKFGNIRTQ